MGIFQCASKWRYQVRSLIYIPPRSIAAEIGVLACAQDQPDMCDTLRKQGIECHD